MAPTVRAQETRPDTLPETRPETRPADAPYAVRGRTELKYIGRWTSGGDDHDLVDYTDVEVGDPRKHLVTLHAAGRFALDLDRDRDPGHPFRSLDDTYGKDATARIYSAYIDVNGVEGNDLRGVLSRIRVGRQMLFETPETIFLDGISVETQPAPFMDLVFTAFVGIPSHLFESSTSGDFTAGAAATASPWRGARARFDYVRVEDEFLSETSRDDLYGIDLIQRVGASLFAFGHVNFLDDDARDLRAGATWTPADGDFSLTARYTSLLSDQTRHSIDFDYFTTFESTYFAYDQYETYAHAGLGEHVYVDGGVQVRELRHDDNEGVFNHEFRRYYVTPGVTGWPSEGTQASLAWAFWDAGGDRFSSFGADLTQKLDEKWSGSVGTSFDLYRYDVLTAQEQENVQTSYIKVAYRPTDRVRVRASFLFEDGDAADYYTVVLGTEVRF